MSSFKDDSRTSARDASSAKATSSVTLPNPASQRSSQGTRTTRPSDRIAELESELAATKAQLARTSELIDEFRVRMVRAETRPQKTFEVMRLPSLLGDQPVDVDARQEPDAPIEVAPERESPVELYPPSQLPDELSFSELIRSRYPDEDELPPQLELDAEVLEDCSQRYVALVAEDRRKGKVLIARRKGLRKRDKKIKKRERELKKIKGSVAWKYIRLQRRVLKALRLWPLVLFLLGPFRRTRGQRRRKRVERWHALYSLLPVRNQTVFFESHRGLSYSGNPKAICEELLRSGLPVECVWSVEDDNLLVPEGVQKVQRFTRRYAYYHARAGTLVHNAEFAHALPIRKKQAYINTQHGTPIKLMGSDIPSAKKKPPADRRWTHFVSPNPYSTEIFERVWRYEGPTLEVGYPRNDIFYNRNTPKDIRAIKFKFGIPQDKKVLIYAPTWRDTGARVVDSKFRLQLDLDRLYETFGETHVIILRLHHLIVSALEIKPEHYGFVFECSNALFDIQELLLISDVLITDYSSVMFDFANLKRPTIFFAYDLAEYTTKVRGLYFDLKEKGPGPVVETMDELLAALVAVEKGQDDFEEARAAFHREFCVADNGTSSAEVVRRLIAPRIENAR